MEIKLTKKGALEIYKRENKTFIEEKRHSDKLALITDWNFFTDRLCKDGLITQKQFATWSNPFEYRNEKGAKRKSFERL